MILKQQSNSNSWSKARPQCELFLITSVFTIDNLKEDQVYFCRTCHQKIKVPFLTLTNDAQGRIINCFIPRRSSDSSVFTWYPRPADSNLWIMSSVCLQDNNFAAIREKLKYTKFHFTYYYGNVLAIQVELSATWILDRLVIFLNSIFVFSNDPHKHICVRIPSHLK